MRFYCVTSEHLTDTNAVLRSACEARDIEFLTVTAESWQPELAAQVRRGDLLYRAASGVLADRMERLLWQPFVAAFYDNPFFECFNQSILLARSGVPMPATLHVVPRERDALAQAVDRLGGFPVVLKVPGGEGGQGVLRVDSLPALFSVLDHLPENVSMSEYVQHVLTYRLVVLGREVIATEARHAGAFDFRSNAAGNHWLGAVHAPIAAEHMAIQSARTLKLEFGGADVLETADGRLVLAELNFPCYFADQQIDTGVDIAGRMLDFLIRKGRRLHSEYSRS